MRVRIRERRGSVWAALALAAITGALLVPVSITLDAEPAGATPTDVASDQELRDALADVNVDEINLTADIQMNCSVGFGMFVRNASGPWTIKGVGQTYKIDATGCGKRVLFISPSDAPLTLQDVTISGGDHQGTSSEVGGGIQSNSDVTLLRSTLDNNKVTNTTAIPSGPSAYGGGIYVTGGKTLTLIESTVSNNVAQCMVCLFGSNGGGVYASNIVLRNSTVSGNSVISPAANPGFPAQGGGIATTTSITMAYSTVGPNTGPTAANLFTAGSLTSFASVVSGPSVVGANCAAVTKTSQGYNYEQAASSSCGFTVTGTGDATSSADPGLGVLGAGGGPTKTRYPTPSSPLLEKIPAASCNSGLASGLVPLTDQRGIPRPRGRGCDIGAVERPAGSFRAVDPVRILDTRPGALTFGPYNTPFPAGDSRDITVLDGTIVPTSGVEAVLLNVTVTNAARAGWLTLFPADTSLPTTSNLNFTAGQTVPNLVVAKVASDDGKVTINNTGGNAAAGTADVIVDIVGYYDDATIAPPVSKFFGLPTPVRIVDTRPGGIHIGPLTTFGPQGIQTLQVSNSTPGSGVPVDASAVVMNVTATGPTAGGWLTLFPSGPTPPTASNLNFTAGQTVPNLVTVKLDTDGPEALVKLANTFGSTAAGTTNVIADVVGYYKDDYTGGSLVPMAPQRILDTRFGTGGVNGPVAPGATITVDPKTATGLPARGQYLGVVVNVTVTGPTQPGWLTVFNAADSTPPTASNLNFLAGQTVPNLVKISVDMSDVSPTWGKLKIANTFGGAGGSAHIIVDLVGYYTGNGSL